MSSTSAAARFVSDEFMGQGQPSVSLFTTPSMADGDAGVETETDLEAKLVGFVPWAARATPVELKAALYADIPGHGPTDDDARAL